MKKAFILLVTLLFLVVLSVTYKKLVLDYNHQEIYPSKVTVLIPPNTSAKSIGAILEKENVIPSQDIFYWSIRIRRLDRKLHSGEYEFPKTRDLKSVIKILVEGDILYHQLTIPEGLTTQEITTILNENQKLTGEIKGNIPEGTLLPETYTFPRGMARNKLLSKMRADLVKVIDRLWEKRTQDLPLKNKEEALILASIIEKETRLASERPHIAAVFLNRLKKGMPLQTDPTVIYAITLKEKKPFKRSLLKTDLAIDSPYNTYLNAGLPPSPICHSGELSLRAALNPAKSDNLFFVADGSGGHVFSKTYREHAKNHSKWRKIKRLSLK